MKILMIAPQPFFQPRGTPFSVYYRTKMLVSLGHQVDIVTYHVGRDVVMPGVRIFRIPTIPFIQKVKIGPSLPKLIMDVPLFFTTLWKLCTKKYDYIHAHEEGIFFCLVYKLFFWRTKVLYDMHSSLPQQLRNFGFSNSRILLFIFTTLERLSLRMSDAVITICPELQEAVDATRIRVPSAMIENTLFDNVTFSDPGDDISDDLINWQKFKNKKIILYSGTFEKYQGIPMLIEAIPHVIKDRSDVIFMLVGGMPGQISAMRQSAAKLGIKDRVVFTGNLPPNTVRCFLRKADILVSPRIHGNNTPLKLYEYIASGKPIVATRHHTHTQVLTDNEAILTDLTPSAFAEGILVALNTPAKAQNVARNARELFQKSYSDVIYQTKLQELIRHLSHRPSVEANSLAALNAR